MPSFEYLALDNTGRKARGFVEADSERLARQQLRERQLTPVRLQQAQTRPPRLRWQHGVPASELALFTRHLAALIQAGVPLEEALQACAQQTGHRRMKAVILGVRSRVLEGQSLSYGLDEHPRVFPPLFRALVQAGEQSGDLAQVLIRLADYSERARQLHNQVLQAALYPLTLTLVASGVVALLMVYVVPRVVEQFEHVGQALPWLTRLMITLSDYLSQYGILSLLLGTLLLLVLQRLFRVPGRRQWLHRRLLQLPLLRGLLVRLETARLFGTLSIMSASGVPLLEALQTSQQTLGNLHIRARVAQATEQVREGRSLSKALGNTAVFPPIAIYMLANGEQSGELEQALARAAVQQEQELNRFIGLFTRLLEPLLIVVFGVLVAAIVLAILLPILQLNNLTQF